METRLEDLTNKALALPMEERTILAQKLWASVKNFVDPEIETAWLKVTDQRWQDIEDESVNCIPADQAISMAKVSLKKR